MIKKYKKVIIIFGIIILPLIYSFFYLKAFWDPYGNIDNIPVALVNLDKCENNCKSEELIKKLKDKNTFNFDVVSEDEANNGLINKDYYAIITIPKNFSSSFENGNSRQQTTITYSPNKKTNYLASQIIGNAVSKIEANLNSEVDKKIVKKLTNSIQSFPEETKKVADGFNQLSVGSKSLKDGTTKLYSGLNDLSLGYQRFNDGINSLNNNSAILFESYKQFDSALYQVNNGIQYLNDNLSKIDELADNVNNLNEMSKQFNSSLNNYNETTSLAFDDMETTYQAIIDYYNAHPEAINDENFANILKQSEDYITNNKVETIKNMSASLVDNNNVFMYSFDALNNNTEKLGQITTGANELNGSMKLLQDNSKQILNGIDKINEEINQLSNNSNNINNGLNGSLAGVELLNNGFNDFDNNISMASNELNNKLLETNNEVKELDGLDDYAKEPVKTVEKDYGSYKEYGIFFAPYFMSLSLWVGGIMIMMGLYYDPDQRFKILGRYSQNKVLRLAFYIIIAIVQALLLGFILKLSLGFTVTNNLLYYGSCILISMTFLVIIMFLFFNFKDVGRFLSLVFLILQLTACAGTFPIETVPTFFKVLYSFIPMTYSVDLLRESFVSINSDFVLKNVSILMLWLFVFTILILITGYFKQKKEKNL